MQLSKRLAAIAAFVQPGERLADIGTDHAFLPIALVQAGTVPFAVASDIGAGPVAIASRNVTAAGLSDQIAVRQADGLASLKPEDAIATVVIAGLGGELMCHLLSAGRQALDGTETLILAPHRDPELVRQWLAEHEFGILDEALVADEGHVYPIMVAGQTAPAVPYTRADLILGPILKQRGGALFQQELARRIHATKKVIAGLQQAHQLDHQKLVEAQTDLAIMEEAHANHRE